MYKKKVEIGLIEVLGSVFGMSGVGNIDDLLRAYDEKVRNSQSLQHLIPSLVSRVGTGPWRTARGVRSGGVGAGIKAVTFYIIVIVKFHKNIDI